MASKVDAFLGRGKDFRFSKDIEDLVILENREELQEAVLTFLPASSGEREDLVIDLIERLGRVI